MENEGVRSAQIVRIDLKESVGLTARTIVLNIGTYRSLRIDLFYIETVKNHIIQRNKSLEMANKKIRNNLTSRRVITQ